MHSGNTKGKIYEIAVFTRVSGDLKFIRNSEGYTNKVPVGELEICIAIRID